MTMVYVPGGTFQMGSTDSDLNAQADEKPQHAVTLDAFWLDQTEVTNAQYNRCVEAGRCQASAYANDTTWNGADYPVVGVSWNDATAYCQWAGGRLPTEAEWEYAACGPENHLYPWGNEFDPAKLNATGKEDGFENTAPVGRYPAGASWVGALDLAGNVWEWVNDWYGPYPAAAQTNPTGPDSGASRVLGGGSSYNDGGDVRGAGRYFNGPDGRYSDIGVRCVVSPGR
jgi:serine/threonine-protein kinase